MSHVLAKNVLPAAAVAVAAEIAALVVNTAAVAVAVVAIAEIAVETVADATKSQIRSIFTNAVQLRLDRVFIFNKADASQKTSQVFRIYWV